MHLACSGCGLGGSAAGGQFASGAGPLGSLPRKPLLLSSSSSSSLRFFHNFYPVPVENMRQLLSGLTSLQASRPGAGFNPGCPPALLLRPAAVERRWKKLHTFCAVFPCLGASVLALSAAPALDSCQLPAQKGGWPPACPPASREGRSAHWKKPCPPGQGQTPPRLAPPLPRRAHPPGSRSSASSPATTCS